MVWIVEEESTQQQLSDRFKALIQSDSILKIPGAYDGLTSLIAKKTGFQALYLSGAAYSASRGLPDLGIVGSEEVARRARDLVRASNLPLLVDIDTGFGGVLNVARTAREMVEAKVAAVQIEDQELPKKCGHLNGKKVIDPAEMAQKIAMIKKAAPSLLVIARTDARSVLGLEETIARAKLYVEAGADGIFPEALADEKEFRACSREIKAPLLANMTEFGKTPYYSAEQFQQMGYSMVIYPVSALRVAAKACELLFAEIMKTGSQKEMVDRMQTRQELYELIQYFQYEGLDQSIAKTILPES
ncbi:methylisocitrate lyase [Paenibacillus montanisoli]|uniref:Methylisocitrate lyase n=1 Tax=Paenibacillus montanisoli TaxID=2081970 RepID=A0A328UCY5_9BACL|nr:methylisocitrate lyase [Paenibacillus montanisoli]RAP77906.1 methylisocitrate lyase [Paenibacillus montanisoli]